MMSEPGSPQAMDLSSPSSPSSSDDEMRDSDSHPTLSQSPESHFPSRNSTPWHASRHLHRPQPHHRVPTPSIPPPGARPLHVRGRHPQENLSSSPAGVDHLALPSPIPEHDAPTPPSAAEAAGSQLSMLSVHDMEVETPPGGAAVPRIAVDAARGECAVDVDGEGDGGPMDGGVEVLAVRKPRQRSGAVSSGHGGSGSPMRGGGGGFGGGGAGGGGMGGGMGMATGLGGSGSMGSAGSTATTKRGFSMGFRADCEKCRLRVPGHLNHFVAS